MFLECLHLNTWIFFIHRGCTAVNKSANCFLMQNAVLFEREDREYSSVLEDTVTTKVALQQLPAQWILCKMDFVGYF